MARLLAGFLTLYLAFLLREHPLPGLSGPLLLGLVVVAAGLGNALGSVAGNLLRDLAPERIALSCLVVGTFMCVATATFYSAWTVLAMGLVAGLTAQLSKLSSDAAIQRDVAESVRARVFAWSETALQIAWVVGGALGIACRSCRGWGSGWSRPCWWPCSRRRSASASADVRPSDAARAPDGRSVRLRRLRRPG